VSHFPKVGMKWTSGKYLYKFKFPMMWQAPKKVCQICCRPKAISDNKVKLNSTDMLQSLHNTEWRTKNRPAVS